MTEGVDKKAVREERKLLIKYGFKRCSKCGVIKATVDFNDIGYRCKLCVSKRMKEYRKNNKESIKLWHKEFYINNKKYYNDYQKNYYNDNKELYSNRHKIYYDKNKDKLKERSRIDIEISLTVNKDDLLDEV